MTSYRARVPAYTDLTSDGAQPKTTPGSGLDTCVKIVKYWQGQGTFVDGLTQETCRNFTHTGYGSRQSPISPKRQGSKASASTRRSPTSYGRPSVSKASTNWVKLHHHGSAGARSTAASVR